MKANIQTSGRLLLQWPLLSGLLSGLLSIIFAMPAGAQNLPLGFPAAGSPKAPKMTVDWSRYYSYGDIVQLCKEMSRLHPQLAQLSYIGPSFEQRPIPVLTLFAKDGPNSPTPDERPAYYMDGNIHANEIQASEVCLYTAWYLCEMYGQSPFIDSLLRTRVFYIIPTINPDGREHFLRQPNTQHSPRSGTMPRDDDRDGQFDEDNFDDLDGDGHITTMIRPNPKGKFYLDPTDKRHLLHVPNDREINGPRFDFLGTEGIDNDGDGKINEDQTGYYDPNRDWPWAWESSRKQRGAGALPMLQPENRAVRDFIYDHPNIAGAITYHNTGGMLLHGPGNVGDTNSYSRSDLNLYNNIGKVGERLLPGYKVLTTYKDLYSTYGGESDWMHGALGICAWTGELFTSYLMYHRKTEDYFAEGNEAFTFDRELLFGDAWVPYKAAKHPTYGDILVGGATKFYSRATPGFLMAEDLHRNMAFALYHAHELPRLRIDSVDIKPRSSGLYELTVTIANDGKTPTHLDHDVSNHISPANIVRISGPKDDEGIVAGMTVSDLFNNRTEWPTDRRYSRLLVPNIPGEGEVILRWWLKPGTYELEVVSPKGGTLRHTVRVQ